jgi:hypothetical protein
VETIGTERTDTELAVILGVGIRTWSSAWPWAWTIWAEKPGRGQRAYDRGGLGKAPTTPGGGFRSREVLRGREGTSRATGPLSQMS